VLTADEQCRRNPTLKKVIIGGLVAGGLMLGAAGLVIAAGIARPTGAGATTTPTPTRRSCAPMACQAPPTRVYLRGNRTENGLIELCRSWQGEAFHQVRWPHGRRSQHNAKELVPASRSWR
jgi:hypothetical protein